MFMEYSKNFQLIAMGGEEIPQPHDPEGPAPAEIPYENDTPQEIPEKA